MDIEPLNQENLPESQQRAAAAFDRIVGNTVSTGVVTWLSAATGSPESAAAVGGMIGPLAEELSFAIRKALFVQQARGQHMVDEAANRAQVSLEDFLGMLLSDESKVELLLRTLEAASRSTTDAKLDVISELLATGALSNDQAVIDEQLLAIDAIRELDPPHFRLLLILDEPSPVWWDNQQDRARLRRAWPEKRIIERDPGLENGLTAIVARLQALGLAREVPYSSNQGPLWELTLFGSTCLRAVRDRKTEKSSSTLGVGMANG